MRFSERYGYKTARETIRIDSISQALRNSLWSLLKIHIWDRVHYSYNDGGVLLSASNPELKRFCERLWFHYFKRPLDTLSHDWSEVRPFLREYFFACSWHEVYDFIEFVAENFPYSGRDNFVEACNTVLETEVSAYRFINGLVSRITDEVEVTEIDTALAASRGPVRTHLRRALELLSDRQAPDYRNSIKESISAVESLVASVVGQKGTLGQLVKKLEDDIGLHPALRTAFSNLTAIRRLRTQYGTQSWNRKAWLSKTPSSFSLFVRHSSISSKARSLARASGSLSRARDGIVDGLRGVSIHPLA